ncbi:MAG: amidase [Acidobacteria bacterium]|nr:amidase [Acidobacteriota bacterium]
MSGDPSVRTRTERALARIASRDREVGSFVSVLSERALATADRLDADPASRSLPLAGCAIGVKELFDVAGADNSYGSLVREGLVAERDAAVVSLLEAAGAVTVGTTRSHEFGWGITTQHARRGSTANPWNLGCVPGGSSGGSAAAVAAGIVDLAVGSDTGGSIRLPAAYCGVLGLKTTWGRITRHGGVSLAPSFDTPGFLARTVDLLARGFVAVAGPDPRDPATLRAAAPSAEPALRADGLRIGIPAAAPRMTAARARAFGELVAALRVLGATVVEVAMPDPDAAFAAFVPHQMAEAHHVHATALGTWPSKAGLYGDDVRSRLEAASGVGVTAYLDARAAAVGVTGTLLAALSGVDAVLTVVGATGPSTVDDPDHVATPDGTVPLRQSAMPTTVPQNLAGLPSVTFPFGSDDGIPVGMQLTGAPFDEPRLLAVARLLEREGVLTVPRPGGFPADGD